MSLSIENSSSPHDDKRLFLLDAYALIYRAYFSFIRSPRINSQRMNTSAAFGFTLTLLDLIKREKPTHIAVVFDTAAPTERHIVHTEYKANRQEMPDDIRTITSRSSRWATGSTSSRRRTSTRRAEHLASRSMVPRSP